MLRMLPFLTSEVREQHSRRNSIHSVVLVLGLGLIAATSAALVWGLGGVLGAAIVVAMFWFITPHIPIKRVMAMYRARPMDPRHGREYERVLDILSDRADLPSRPSLWVIPSSTLNAFATGTPDKAAIAVTDGLLRHLDLREVAGVLAHEVSHIRNNDLRTMAFADLMTRMTQLLAMTGLFLALLNIPAALFGKQLVPWSAALVLYLAPTIGSLLQLGLSRAREYDADLEGAQLTGDPMGLALALKKLDHFQGAMWEDMFMLGRRIPYPSLLRSHPPTEDRIERLKELHVTLPPVQVPENPVITLTGFTPSTIRPSFHAPWPGIWY